MNFKKQEFLISFSIFSIINILIWTTNLLWTGALGAMGIILYFFVRIGCYYNDPFSMKEWLGAYLGGTFFNIYIQSLFKYDAFQNFGTLWENWCKNFFPGNSVFLIFFGVLLVIAFFSKKKNIILNIIAYVWIGGICFVCCDLNKVAVLLPFLVLWIGSFFVTRMIHRTGSERGVINYRWSALVIASFALFYSMKIPATREILISLYNFRARIVFPGYVFLIALFFLIAGGFLLFMHRRSTSKITEADDWMAANCQNTKILITLGGWLMFLYQLFTMSTILDLIFLFAMALATIILTDKQPDDKLTCIETVIPKVNKTVAFVVSKQNLSCLATFVCIALLQKAFFDGIIVEILILLLGTCCVVAYCNRYQTVLETEYVWKRIPWDRWGFWQLILCITFVYAVFHTWKVSHYGKVYLLLVCLTVLVTAALWLIDKHERAGDGKGIVRYFDCVARVVVTLMAVLTLLNVSDQVKTSITFAEKQWDGDELRVQVCIEDGTRASAIVKRSLYWLGEEDNVYESENVNTHFPWKNGCLCVEVLDKDGVLTRAYHWFYRSDYDELDYGGLTAENSETPEKRQE